MCIRDSLLESSYEKTIPPITTVSTSNFSVVPVPVKVSILLMKIIKMEEVEHKIDLQFQISRQWTENRASSNQRQSSMPSKKMTSINYGFQTFFMTTLTRKKAPS